MLTHHRLGQNGRYSNQLFQIASTIGIAIKNNHEYVFPYWEFNSYFGNKLPISNIQNYNIIGEQSFGYTEYNIPEGIYSLDGYFQSEKYFNHCRDLILNLFKPNDDIINYINHKYNWVNDNEYCSIHVRRGDYLQLPHHPVQPIEYYRNAIDMIKAKKYIIFSDDIDWCKSNFIGNEFDYITGENGIVDQHIMSMCQNHIISNSTFSWWGAWKNRYIHKKVIAPKMWFAGVNSHLETKDIYCEGWIII